MIDQRASGVGGAPPSSCLDENDALAFVAGQLTAARASEIEHHVDGCAPCRWLLSAVARAATAISGEISPTLAPDLPLDSSSGASSEDGEHARAVRLLRPGQQLGRYAIGGVRGIGSMGVVYAAHDTELDRAVALKLLRSDAARGAIDQGRARLVREAQALAKLSHPNVVAIHDIGVHDDEVFVAMELVEGAALDEWLHAPARTVADKLAALIGAGRGLAAAHAAGLIHRDVKPENILVGLDGRARMTDFGLVHVAASEAPPIDDDAAGAAHLTRTGALLGTPAYMSPEQLSAKPVGPASDQFSFAVTLYEALYGARPFRGDTLATLRMNVLAGVIEVPRGAAVPARVRRVLQRALAVDPARRYPSMDALLGELADERPARRRLVVAIAAVALTIGALWLGTRDDAPPPCTGAAGKLWGVWDAARRPAVAHAFIASGEPLAGDALARVTRGLDAYTRGWVAMHTEACVASAVRGEQPPEVLTRRMACLGKDLALTQQLVDLLAAPGFTGTAQAVVAVDRLPRIADCADLAALAAVTPLPADPIRRAQLAALDDRVAELKARWLVNDLPYVRRTAPALAAEARTLGYAPTIATVSLVDGEAESEAGAARPAEDTLYAALWAAEAAHDAEQTATAWIQITRVVGVDQRRFAEGERLLRNAEQAVERATAASPAVGNGLRVSLLGVSSALAYANSDLKTAAARASEALALEQQHVGDDTARAATLHHRLALIKLVGGDPAGAWPEAQRALAISEQRFGVGPDLIKLRGAMATILQAQGKFPEAIAAYERTLAMAAQVYTSETPEIAKALGSLASLYQAIGQHDRAVPLLERALAILIKTRGPASVEVSSTLRFLGLSAALRGQLPAARSYFERALAISERAEGPTHFHVSEHLISLGEVLVQQGEAARAIPLLERGVAIVEARRASGQGMYPAVVANARFVLAQALWTQPAQRARARALVASASALLDPKARDPRMKGVVTAIAQWSAAHR